MLRDRITDNRQLEHLNSKCYACNSINHFITKCDRIHLILNKDFRIKKLNYSKPILERISFLRKRKKYPCALLTMQKFNRTISEIESNESEEEGDSYAMNSLNTFEFDRKGNNLIVRKSKLGANQMFPTAKTEILDNENKQEKQEEVGMISEKNEKIINKDFPFTKNMTLYSNLGPHEKKAEGKGSDLTKMAQLSQNIFDFEFDAMKNYEEYFSRQNCFQVVGGMQTKRRGNDIMKRKRRRNIMEVGEN